MQKSLAAICAAAFTAVSSAKAEAPVVVTDIAPVHSLVARLMEGVGTPGLIVRPGASPHAYSLRPSEAAALEEAQIVFWIGEALTPWLEDSIETLADDAVKVELLEVPGTITMPFRDTVTFAVEPKKDHEEHSDHDQHSDHEDHSDHSEIERAHDHEHEHEQHGHDHSGIDPHAWLDPENAKVWLEVVAAELTKADPQNAETYRANARAAKAEIEALTTRIEEMLGPVQGSGFVVFHDAYHYFENRFGLTATGAISLSDASPPSPGRIAEIREATETHSIECVFAEPQFNSGIVDAVFGGTDTRVVVIDPMGSDLQPGPELYGALLGNLAAGLADCV